MLRKKQMETSSHLLSSVAQSSKLLKRKGFAFLQSKGQRPARSLRDPQDLLPSPTLIISGASFPSTPTPPALLQPLWIPG